MQSGTGTQEVLQARPVDRKLVVVDMRAPAVLTVGKESPVGRC